MASPASLMTKRNVIRDGFADDEDNGTVAVEDERSHVAPSQLDNMEFGSGSSHDESSQGVPSGFAGRKQFITCT